MRARRPTGFTLIDLCVCLVLLLLLFGAALPEVVGRMGEQARRIRCGSNLRLIGQGLQLYTNTNRGNFPRTVYDGVGGPPLCYTGWQAPNAFGPGGPGPNDVTAALFLLARTADPLDRVEPECFVCPSTEGRWWDFNGGPPTAVSNFPGREFLSYSYVNSYPTAAAVKAGFKLNYRLSADFVVAADMNPGGPAATSVGFDASRRAIQPANSPNHNGDGQNVLFADGHVDFSATPFCGMQRPAGPGAAVPYRDNIYTFGSVPSAAAGPNGIAGAPVDALDSVLLPAVADGPQPAARLRSLPRIMYAGAAILAGILVCVIVLAFRLRGRGPASAGAGDPE